jgi:VanZ family protein
VPKKIWLWIALAWTTVIAVLCLISFRDLPSVKMQDADKYVHTIFHFLFTVLWYQHFTNVDKPLPQSRILARVLCLSIIYGCLIEIAQEYLTTTRQADIKDVLANTTGAILAVVLLTIYNKLRKSHTA